MSLSLKQESCLLSIIIVNYNTRNLLRDCLLSIRQNVHPGEHEVIVVDNNSRDGSLMMLKSDFQEVILISNDENLGFGKACNQGIIRSGGKYLLLLNSDTRILPGALEKMLNFLENHPGVGISGGKMLFPNGSIIPSVKPFPTYSNLLRTTRSSLFNHIIGYNALLPERRPPETTSEVEAIAGGYLFIRREALLHTGLMDERFFMYMEDVDLALRMRKSGWKTVFYPSSEVTHILEGTSSKYKSRSYFYHHMSLFKYFNKHFKNRFFLNYLLFAGLIGHYCLWLILKVFISPERK
ncbi:glycosyltransferase family 2 protein [bacterium]|nr:glycosyltransferase family 2 protein [bacterium]